MKNGYASVVALFILLISLFIYGAYYTVQTIDYANTVETKLERLGFEVFDIVIESPSIIIVVDTYSEFIELAKEKEIKRC